jgi:hypothetical protein
VDLGEPAARDEPDGVGREGAVAGRVERDDLQPGGHQRLQRVAVGEGEGPPSGHGHRQCRPGGEDRGREAHRADGQGRRALGQADDGVEVDLLGHGRRQVGERPAHVARAFGHGDEAQVAVAPRQPVVAPQGPQDRQAEGGEGVAQERLVPVGPHPVEYHPRHIEPGVEPGEPRHEGGHRAGHRPRVHHQDHRRAEGAGHIRGRGGRAVRGAVEEAHDALDDQQVGGRARPGGQRPEGVGAAHPGVEVAGRPPAGQGVVAGVDEVGAHLGGRGAQPGPPQGGDQPRGHGRLAHTRMGAGDHDPGAEGSGRRGDGVRGRRP